MRGIKKIKIAVIVFFILSVSLVWVSLVNALTQKVYITVKVNNNCIKMDSLPYIKDGRTLIPIRSASEALGAKVEWIAEEKKIIITQTIRKDGAKGSGTTTDVSVTDDVYASNVSVTDDVYANNTNPDEFLVDNMKIIELFVGSNKVVVNGKEKLMDSKVETSNGRTMVPIRFIAENLDSTVKWEPSTYTVLIEKKDVVVPAAYIDKKPYTKDDIIWLSRIIHVEGKGLSINAKVAIANVVLNRKKSTRFPDTIYNVIFDKSYSVQFPPAYKAGFKTLTPNNDCIIAAKMALEGVNNIERCLFFNSVPFKSKSATLYKRIDGMYFYY